MCVKQFLLYPSFTRSTVQGEENLIMCGEAEIKLHCNTILPFIKIVYCSFTVARDRHPKSHKLLSHVIVINTFIVMSRGISKSN